MFYESMREDNGGIPVEGDPFQDEEENVLLEAVDKREELLEQIEAEARWVLEFLVNEFIFRGVTDDFFLRLYFEQDKLTDAELISSEEAAKVRNAIPLPELVTDNGRGDMLPDLRKIGNVLTMIQLARLQKK